MLNSINLTRQSWQQGAELHRSNQTDAYGKQGAELHQSNQMLVANKALNSIDLRNMAGRSEGWDSSSSEEELSDMEVHSKSFTQTSTPLKSAKYAFMAVAVSKRLHCYWAIPFSRHTPPSEDH